MAKKGIVWPLLIPTAFLVTFYVFIFLFHLKESAPHSTRAGSGGRRGKTCEMFGHSSLAVLHCDSSQPVLSYPTAQFHPSLWHKLSARASCGQCAAQRCSRDPYCSMFYHAPLLGKGTASSRDSTHRIGCNHIIPEVLMLRGGVCSSSSYPLSCPSDGSQATLQPEGMRGMGHRLSPPIPHTE